MNKQSHYQKVTSFLSILKPWITGIVIVLVLQYSGALSQISYVTQATLLQTGIMDINPGNGDKKGASFNYNFSIRDLEGNAVDFNQFKGKVIFLNLWATWCGPCRVEMPSIQNLYSSVDQENIVFVMLSLDVPENQSKVVKYVRDKEFSFPVYTATTLTNQLNVPSIPTTFVIGKDGKIRSKEAGAANYDTEKFRKFLNTLVAE